MSINTEGTIRIDSIKKGEYILKVVEKELYSFQKRTGEYPVRIEVNKELGQLFLSQEALRHSKYDHPIFLQDIFKYSNAEIFFC